MSRSPHDGTPHSSQDGTVLPFPAPRPPAASAAPTVQGTLALDLSPRLDPPTVREARPATAGSHGADVVSVDLRRRRGVEQWSRRFAQAAVEIVGGDRPVSQLLRWTSTSVYADLDRRAQLVARAGGHRPACGRTQPVRPKVLSVHTCFVSPRIVEASVHVRYGERSRALAARFEQRAGLRGDDGTGQTVDPRWVCTALDWA